MVQTEAGLMENYLVVFILKVVKMPCWRQQSFDDCSYICLLEHIIKQLSLWSVLMTATYLLSVLGPIFSVLWLPGFQTFTC